MILGVILRLAIAAGLGLVGLMLGLLLVLAGLPAWLVWAMPLWFGVVMPGLAFILGAAATLGETSRRGRRLGQPQRPIASHPRRREPRLEDLYP